MLAAARRTGSDEVPVRTVGVVPVEREAALLRDVHQFEQGLEVVQALNFGAGSSSLERVVVYAEVTQGNFDLFNRRSLYQGAGQKFRLRLQLGTRSSEVLLSFEEPWLFQHELALGFTVFRTSAD